MQKIFPLVVSARPKKIKIGELYSQEEFLRIKQLHKDIYSAWVDFMRCESAWSELALEYKNQFFRLYDQLPQKEKLAHTHQMLTFPLLKPYPPPSRYTQNYYGN